MMNQKSVIQTLNSVPKVLTLDSGYVTGNFFTRSTRLPAGSGTNADNWTQSLKDNGYALDLGRTSEVPQADAPL